MNLSNPNFAQDTYAGMLIKSELEVSKYLSDLVGWNYKKTHEFIDLKLDEILKLSEQEIEKIRNYNVNYSKYVLNKSINNEISFCYTSSRSYVVPGTNIKIGALKAYLMSVFLDKEETDRIVKEINKTILDYKKLDNEEIGYNTISDDMVYRK